MATNGINSYNGIRMAGLVSGLDTEELVKQMSFATKQKINLQQQKLDLLSWKQQSYRSVIDKINKFKGNYFDILKPDTNLSSNKLMGAYQALSSLGKITASAGTNATPATYKIENIERLAESAKLESSGRVAGGINLDFTAAESADEAITSNLKITVDGFSADITFTQGLTKEETEANFKAALQDAGLTNLNVDGGKLTYQRPAGESENILHTITVGVSDLDNTDSIQDTLNKKDASLSVVGLDANATNRISASSKLGEISFGTELVGNAFSFKINGKSFSFTAENTLKDVMDAVNSSDADVKLSFDSLAQKFTLESTRPGAAGNLRVEQETGNLLSAMFGTDKFGSTGAFSANIMPQKITGEALADGVDFNALKNTTFKVTVNGVTKDIGIWGYDSNGERYDYSDQMNADGTVKKYGAQTVADALNEELSRAFGEDAPRFSYDSDSKQFTIKNASADDVFQLGAVDYPVGSGSDLLNALGYKPRQIPPPTEVGDTSIVYVAGNQMTEETTLGDLYGADFEGGSVSLAAGTFTISADTKLSDLEGMGFKLGRNSDGDFNGEIVLDSALTGADDGGKAFIEELFGAPYDTIAANAGVASGNQSYEATGKNAVVTINGTTLSNASNSIEIDGTTINLGNLTQADIDKINAGEAATVTTSRDTSKAYDAVVKFVNDYNTLISELNTEIRTRRPTSDGSLSGSKYEPLTDDQREEMSDKEIERWEEKAKEGLLYQDSTIAGFLTKLRSAMNTRTVDGFSLHDMGIEVSSAYTDNGKLVIKDESKLKNAFEQHADKIQELFTKPVTGLAAQVTRSIDGAVSTNRTSLGSLTRIAGIANTSTQTENTISKQIESYQKIIDSLNRRYENEQSRYWSQFTRLETMMNQYSAQSSWLLSQFGQGM